MPSASAKSSAGCRIAPISMRTSAPSQRPDPPSGVAPDEAVAEVRDVLDSCDTCPVSV